MWLEKLKTKSLYLVRATIEYDIPKSVIQMTSRNVLIGLNLTEVVKKYKVLREEPLPTSIPAEEWIQGTNLDLVRL